MAKEYPANDDQDEAKVEKSQVGYFKLFRFATKFELFLLFLGICFTVVKACGMPLMIIVYGEFTTLLVDRAYRIGTSSSTVFLHAFGGGKVLTNATVEENRIEIINDSISYGILMTIVSLMQFVTGIFSIDLFNYTALKQVTRMRIKFFGSLLRQEVGWYDVSKDMNFAVRISGDIEKIRAGIGEQVSHFLTLMVGFVICVTLSFVYGWKLTLVVIGYVPIILVTNMIISRFQVRLTAKESTAFAIASSVAEEVLGGIRTVKAFGGEEKESTRYEGLLRPAQKAGIRKGLYSGVGEAVMRMMFYASNALAYWYGVGLVLEDRDKELKEYTPAVLMIAFFGLIVGAENISKTAPFLECFSAAQGAAATIFRVIDRKSKIDSLSSEGKMINYGVVGNIEFNNVFFHYPSRTDVPILNGISTKISCGETVALVGSSGNGKSTCIQLMQRFYDPIMGYITIDGHDIKHFNLSWLRSNMACVGQEPVLFATTIEENISYGKPDASLQEIHDAAKSAGAHDFIVKLQDGYKTMAGERGTQLSGGQKQRIAIARALIQNPKILLLDEATSALDSHSEKIVQETLDKASKGRTTIVVSHRLSAIKNADRIIFLEAGRIVEDGTHDELMKKQGAYFTMMRGSQSAAGGDEDDVSLGEVDNEHAAPEKVVEKQMFTQSQQIYESTNSVVEKLPEEPVEEKEDPVRNFAVMKRILRINRPELLFLGIATISSLIVGASFGAFSILFGEFYGAMSLEDPQAAMDATNTLCIAFLAMGVVVGLAAFLQTYLFNMAGVYLTTRVRSATLTSMIQQDCSWYDDSKNAVGALSVRLTADAASMQGAIGYPLSGIIQSVATFVFGVTISFMYLWKMALVILPTAPLVVMSVLFEAKYMAKTAAMEASGMEEVTKVATEAISNIRTVASLRQETYIYERYCTEIAKLEKLVIKKMSFRGLVNSTGMSIPFFGYALALYYGGMMVANEGVHYKDIIKVSEGLLYGTMMLGQTLAFAPAFTAALGSGHRIFKVIDQRPSIISPDVANKSRRPDKGGSALFKQIDFRYPTRPDVQILDGLNLDVLDGQTVALVGASGCGKSTVIQLLQRLYDPELGRVYLGLDEISQDISIKDLRAKLSIVSQEPILFDRTIAENIAYGDNARTVDLFDIMNAAKTANIHEFIAGLPLGYETKLGSKGAQLSGGQKQRIAIARALVRNPRVLLLDEATSALDLHSEKVVQEALDTARSGRTCLVIAHRLSTIQNADVICVIQLGRVVEKGTHAQLMATGGIYSRLYRSQPTLH